MRAVFPVVMITLVQGFTAFGSSAHAAFGLPGSDKRLVTVQGLCHRQVTSDRGAIILTAETTDMDLNSATHRTTAIYDRVREAVKRLNLENADLQTVEYSVSENREWEKSKSIFKGYRARMGLRVATSSIAKLGEVISIAAREQVKDVGSLTTFMSNEKQMKERLGCLQEASENARARADKLANSLGAKLGEVQEIQEVPDSNGGGRPVPMMAMNKGMADAAPAVEAGAQDLAITIQASFNLK